MSSTRLPILILLAVGCSSLTAQEPPKPRKWAFLVGVNQYDHAKLRALDYAVNDVKELADLLRANGYDVFLLSDEAGRADARYKPTKTNIERELVVVRKTFRKGDTLIAAFAGHGLQFEGVKDCYFCPSDARPFKDETNSLVSLGMVYEELDKAYDGAKILLVDACRDDPRGGRGIDADTAPRPPRGVAALFSCSAGERAFENDKLKHGIFFHYVLEGLKGQAKNRRGEVTFGALAEYVSAEVASETPRLVGGGAKQSPNLKADLSGASPILIRPDIRITPPIAKKGEHDPATGNRFFHFNGSSARGLVVVEEAMKHEVHIIEPIKRTQVIPPIVYDRPIRDAEFAPDGRRVVVRTDASGQLWDPATGKAVGPALEEGGKIWHARFSPNGTRVVTMHDKGVRLWDADTGKAIGGLLPHDRVSFAVLNLDGSRLVTTSLDQDARVWDAVGGKPVGPLVKLAAKSWHTSFHPDGRRAVTSCADGTAQVWDVETGKPTCPALKHRTEVTASACSADGRRIVTAGSDFGVNLWDADTGKPVGPPLNMQGTVFDVAFSPDGKRVAAVGRNIHIWNLDPIDALKAQPSVVIDLHTRSQKAIRFSPDGERIFSVGSQGATLHVWDARSGKMLTNHGGPFGFR